MVLYISLTLNINDSVDLEGPSKFIQSIQQMAIPGTHWVSNSHRVWRKRYCNSGKMIRYVIHILPLI